MSLEHLWRKLNKKADGPKRKVRKLNIGNTDAGRAQLKPVIPKREPDDSPGVERMNIREIPPHRGHASKRHGRTTTIRKAGGGWR